jgi:hypothetical protein
MNSVLQHIAAPPRGGGAADGQQNGARPAPGSRGLGARIAKQMGVQEFAEEAEAVMQQLDELASDPAEYAKVIASIMESGPDAALRLRTLKPDAHFAVTLQGREPDGMKIGGHRRAGTFYMNFVSHKAVQAPEMPNGHAAVSARSIVHTPGLSVPLAIGEMRAVPATAGCTAGSAIDVLVNPLVVEAAMDDYGFKTGLIQLAMQWIETEKKILLHRTWKEVEQGMYVGGRGAAGVDPLPFPLHKDQEGCGQEGSSAEEGLVHMDNPMDLLGAINKRDGSACHAADAEKGEEDFRIHLPGKADPARPSPSRPLISEVTAPASSVPNTSSCRSSTKQGSAIKKGFLQKASRNAPLYPKGSSEGGDGATGGAYSRLMSKCQVVDMSSMSPEEQKRAMREHAVGGGRESAERGNSKAPKGIASTAKPVLPAQRETCNFNVHDQSEAQLASRRGAELDDPLTDVLGEIANMLGNMGDSVPLEKTPSPASQVDSVLQLCVGSEGSSAVITAKLTPEALKSPDLLSVEASGSTLQVRLPGVPAQQTVNVPFPIDVRSVVAKVSRKRETLTVTVSSA